MEKIFKLKKKKPVNPNTLKNLKPFAPGVSGNPNGRPPIAKNIPDILRRIGARNVVDNPLIPAEVRDKINQVNDKAVMLEGLMEIVYFYAYRGDAWAVHFIAERTEGKVPDVNLNANRIDDQRESLPGIAAALDRANAASAQIVDGQFSQIYDNNCRAKEQEDADRERQSGQGSNAQQ